ncbi:glycoside hydrolase family 15 protein [Nakamurella sp. PAMC28650]|uniref:glycoside hydrolase family 15 protein n=1 Tax=Nakamurella sp. PAMC28650 TaxID=2762325 RepID=UPI00164E608B|nr:glycoside hydrolase family 15 protein [Nakamurella sp. PAMC28650]QNK80403.1 glycoside hydrolase family 15 [Nakamurella sp. PAMC28650]QNK81602.1 glycoside hydrolase family 15 [Nakamurella sp. PAMC28650]
MTPTDQAPQAPERAQLQHLAQRSLEVIGQFQDPSGAYPASPTFSAYRGYAWLRDGSFTVEAMSRWGQVDSADRFHTWVSGVLTARAAVVQKLVAGQAAGRPPAPADMLPTRFTLAGGDGADQWWDFQTDGYGMWLWALTTHLQRHHLPVQAYLPAIAVAVDYLTAFGGDACYDWWEEHAEHRHTSTLAAVRAGLIAAAALPGLDQQRRSAAELAAALLLEVILTDATVTTAGRQHLSKWIGTDAVDASLAACVVPFGAVAVDDPLAVGTLDQIAEQLDVGGGVHRFAADVFYGGGQWLLLSCLLGWNRVAAGDVADGWKYLRWAAAQAEANGDLPEQVPGHLLHPEHRQEWITRWGTVATPLLWSHAMYLILAHELGLPMEDETP